MICPRHTQGGDLLHTVGGPWPHPGTGKEQEAVSMPLCHSVLGTRSDPFGSPTPSPYPFSQTRRPGLRGKRLSQGRAAGSSRARGLREEGPEARWVVRAPLQTLLWELTDPPKARWPPLSTFPSHHRAQSSALRNGAWEGMWSSLRPGETWVQILVLPFAGCDITDAF